MCVCSSSKSEDYDYGMLHQFYELFPQSPLAKMVLAYFEYSGIHVEKEDDEDKTPRKLTADDEFDNIEIMMVRESTRSVCAFVDL